MSKSPPTDPQSTPDDATIGPRGAADRHVALIGFRGCGKSAVGARLAALLGREFIDTDARIEQRAGRTVREIFQQDGEARFRELECAAVREALGGGVAGAGSADGGDDSRVIAVGGGAILAEDTRRRLAATCVCVWLTATPAAIVARLEADPRSATLRPALTAAPLAEEVAKLLAEREPLYAGMAAHRIDTTNISVEDVAACAAAWLKMKAPGGGAA